MVISNPETTYCDWGRRTGDTVLTVVEESDHTIRVHALTGVLVSKKISV